MKTFMKRAVASVLVLALCLGTIGYQKQTAKAAEAYKTLFNGTISDVAAGESISGNFTVPSTGQIEIGAAISAATKCSFSYQIKGSTGNVVTSGTVTSTDAGWETDQELAVYGFNRFSIAAGAYSITLTFAEAQPLISVVVLFYPSATTQNPPTPTTGPVMDSKSLTITKGFKDKITVVNTGGAKLTFTSSNTKVATVDANGNVTAKKKGTATITVKTSTGYTGTCKITVKDNVYSTSKLPLSRVPVGTFSVDVYKVSYDSKGNLVIKTRMLNRNSRKAKYLKNLKITIKNENGKKIGVYSAKKKTINLKSGKAKGYTFKIKKSKLKIKSKQDLRNMSTPRVSGKYYYNLR